MSVCLCFCLPICLSVYTFLEPFPERLQKDMHSYKKDMQCTLIRITEIHIYFIYNYRGSLFRHLVSTMNISDIGLSTVNSILAYSRETGVYRIKPVFNSINVIHGNRDLEGLRQKKHLHKIIVYMIHVYAIRMKHRRYSPNIYIPTYILNYMFSSVYTVYTLLQL